MLREQLREVVSKKTHQEHVYMVPSSVSPPPHGLGPQVAPPFPFYLKAIGSISEVQPRIW